MTAAARPALSVLDLAPRRPEADPGQPFRDAVDLARAAEAAGYRGLWYAEHHNMPGIASSATSVLMAHVAAHTERIRVGAGGVMLSNHAPLVIAEQFGMLEAMHPGRVDLGLGRAPGTDQATVRALRRTPDAAERFPADVAELLAYLDDETRIPGVNAYPGRGARVPVTILGSSLFGATLAGRLGLPFGFASHFAPAQLESALRVYRTEFRPSERLAAPRALVAVGVVAAATAEEAEARFTAVGRDRVKQMMGRGRPQPLSEAEVSMLIEAGAAAQVLDSIRLTAVGTGEQVAAELDRLVASTGADELITVHHAVAAADRLESLDLTARAWGLRG